MDVVRILLAEDMEIVRKGVRALLAANPRFAVVAEAEDGQEAIDKTASARPDVVLMDLSLPRLDGVEAISVIKRRFPQIKVLALTAHGKEQYLSAAVQAGVDGYLLKNSPSAELFAAVDSLVAGQNYFSRAVSSMLANATRSSLVGGDPLDKLSGRERQVLKLAAQGHPNQDIADTLFVSVKTVEKHKTNIKKRLGLRSSLELATFCLENGLVADE